MGFVESVLASLLAAGLFSSGGYVLGKRSANRRYKKQLATAGETYAARLGDLIKASKNANTFNRKDLEVKARSIVGLRDQYRGSLTGLSRLLNSDIDMLASALSESNGNSLSDKSAAQIETHIKVLNNTWDAKCAQFAFEIRKLLTDLGLEPEN